MNGYSWIALVLAIAVLAAAVEAGNDLVLAIPAAAIGVALVGIVGAIELRARSVRLLAARGALATRQARDGPDLDSLLQLRRSFQAGVLGRSSILATLRALERDMVPSGRLPLSFEEEEQVLALPPDGFRRWVEERVRRIEVAT